ncbi:porin PorA family protein [Streptomyces sp. NPDC001595]|uniref:porin PorA family protein n=1 Tax=Streptomyces sp. NPDC001532 TaxID=3154520 RepID=UPI00331B6B51
MRRTSWVLTGTAVVLVAASAVTRFTVYPALHQVPADTRSTFRYEGTATLLDATALGAGDMDKAFLRDVPVVLDRRIEVRDVDGRTAVVSDDVALRGRDGTEMSTSEHTWAVDRRDLTERAAPAGSGAERHEGLVISWPLEPAKRDYRFWDTGTRTVSPARFKGTESVRGREAYVYDIESSGPLADPAVASSLPRTLPREAVLGLVSALPAEQRPNQEALASLPKVVPLSYTSTTERRGWVDADTGLSLNGTLRQTVLARTQGADGPVALFPVTDVDVRGTDASVRQQADDATTTGRLLWLLGIGGPLGLLFVALLLVALALVLSRRRARPDTGTEEAGTDTQTTTTPA